jgi:hypothetical protein
MWVMMDVENLFAKTGWLCHGWPMEAKGAAGAAAINTRVEVTKYY